MTPREPAPSSGDQEHPPTNARRADLVTTGAPTLPPPREEVALEATAPNGWFVGPAEDSDRYELLGTGTTGGEGTTWRARYRGGLQSPLPLAVKVLHRPPGAEPDWPSTAERRRWSDQTALLRHMHLDHVVEVHEILVGSIPHLQHAPGTGEQAVIVVMEWVEGSTLGSLVRGVEITTQTLAGRLSSLEDVCAAVMDLHSLTRSAGNPTVHRDITPSNCLVSPERGVVLIDLSSMQLPTDGTDPTGRHTPSYSAAEVLRSPHAPRLPSADVYAVGALAFFCWTGEDPPRSDAAEAKEAMRARLISVIGSLGLRLAVVDHLLAPMDADPHRRPTDMAGWVQQLRELCAPPRSRRAGWINRRVALVGAIGVVALLGAGSAMFAYHDAHQATGAASGSITSPQDGATVKDCAYFSGRGHVPPGMTLILSQQNATTGDPIHYVEDVFDYQHAATSSTWRGATFFNQAATGQTIRVQLFAVDLEQAIKAAGSSDYQAADALARSGVVLDSVNVVRGAGPDGATRCDPPS